MRADPAARPVPAVRRLGRMLAGALLATAVLLAALAGWQSGPRTASGLLAASAAHLVTAQAAQPGGGELPGPDDRWQSGGRPENVLARARDRLTPTSHLPQERGPVRAGWALLLLLVAVGTAAAGRTRRALVGVSPSRGPPVAA